MQIVLTVLAYALDIIILSMYLKNVLNNLKKERVILYALFLVLTEVVIYASNVYIADSDIASPVLITTLISVVTTFLISFFFECSMVERIIAALVFQVLVFFGEHIFFILIQFVMNRSDAEISDDLFFSIMEGGSKVTLLILCSLIRLLWRTPGKNNHPVELSILHIVTPVITVIVYVTISFRSAMSTDVVLDYNLILAWLLVMNIVNTVLINKVYGIAALKYTNSIISTQLNYQKEKYDQLAESYRNSRRIVHDTKKHFFSLRRMAEMSNDVPIIDYLNEAMGELELNYVRYNTGNLVIDSMLTHYDNLASQYSIKFSAILNVNAKNIPLSNYDLSVVIGNILDNSFEETIDSLDSFIEISIVTTDDGFLLHNENSITGNKDKEADSFNHGYGLINVDNTINKYHGSMYYEIDDRFVLDLCVPVFESRVYSFK